MHARHSQNTRAHDSHSVKKSKGFQAPSLGTGTSEKCPHYFHMGRGRRGTSLACLPGSPSEAQTAPGALVNLEMVSQLSVWSSERWGLRHRALWPPKLRRSLSGVKLIYRETDSVCTEQWGSNPSRSLSPVSACGEAGSAGQQRGSRWALDSDGHTLLSWLCQGEAVWLWASCLTSLSLDSSCCKRGIILDTCQDIGGRKRKDSNVESGL